MAGEAFSSTPLSCIYVLNHELFKLLIGWNLWLLFAVRVIEKLCESLWHLETRGPWTAMLT